MTNAPIVQTIHPGGELPTGWKLAALTEWLPANGINPSLVSVDDPITVLPVPHSTAEPADGGKAWAVQVIVFAQFYVGENGVKESNLITRRPVTFQRTVPLRVAFPTDPTDGEADGEEPQIDPVEEGQRPPKHQGGTQADEQQAVRPAAAEEVPDRRSGARQKRSRQGGGSRVAGAEEGRPQGRDAQVPQPEAEEVAQ